MLQRSIALRQEIFERRLKRTKILFMLLSQTMILENLLLSLEINLKRVRESGND